MVREWHCNSCGKRAEDCVCPPPPYVPQEKCPLCTTFERWACAMCGKSQPNEADVKAARAQAFLEAARLARAEGRGQQGSVWDLADDYERMAEEAKQ